MAQSHRTPFTLVSGGARRDRSAPVGEGPSTPARPERRPARQVIRGVVTVSDDKQALVLLNLEYNRQLQGRPIFKHIRGLEVGHFGFVEMTGKGPCVELRVPQLNLNRPFKSLVVPRFCVKQHAPCVDLAIARQPSLQEEYLQRTLLADRVFKIGRWLHHYGYDKHLVAINRVRKLGHNRCEIAGCREEVERDAFIEFGPDVQRCRAHNSNISVLKEDPQRG